MAETKIYYPQGICPKQFDITLEDGIIKDIQITGGCNGNLKGIARLITGLDARDAIERMEGICCGPRPTSCPDQIARALSEMLAESICVAD